jgi:hypothetical protein
LLHDVEGLAHSEIARNLGCTIGTSKSQLHQARLQLRHFLRRSTVSRRHKETSATTLNFRSRKPRPLSLLSNVPWIPGVALPEQPMARA